MIHWGTLLLFLAAVAQPQGVAADDGGRPSKHRTGPDGLEGWTVRRALPEGDAAGLYAFSLVLARHGFVVRRIEGDPILWKWFFWNGGKQVAYETGPLHFAMSCVLVDIASGHREASYDCLGKLPPNAPKWVRRLEPDR